MWPGTARYRWGDSTCDARGFATQDARVVAWQWNVNGVCMFEWRGLPRWKGVRATLVSSLLSLRKDLGLGIDFPDRRLHRPDVGPTSAWHSLLSGTITWLESYQAGFTPSTISAGTNEVHMVMPIFQSEHNGCFRNYAHFILFSNNAAPALAPEAICLLVNPRC